MKDCIQKSILLDFVNLFTTFIFNSVQTPRFYIFWTFQYFKRTTGFSIWYLGQLSCSKDLKWYISKSTILLFGVKYKFGTKGPSNCGKAVFMKRICFFLLRTNHFWSSDAFLKKQKLEGQFSDNLVQNSCGFFHVLAQFLFTTNEMELDYHQKVSAWFFSRVAEWVKTYNPRKLENSRKFLECLDLIAST